MIISELIELLEEVKEKHGDIEVLSSDDMIDYHFEELIDEDGTFEKYVYDGKLHL